MLYVFLLICFAGRRAVGHGRGKPFLFRFGYLEQARTACGDTLAPSAIKGGGRSRLAKLVECKTLHLAVVGSNPPGVAGVLWRNRKRVACS